MTKGYVGWALPQADRDHLLVVFPPAFGRVVAHHVTLKFGVYDDYPLPASTTGVVVGEVIQNGVQALVVSIGGTTARPGGGIYHITWSLAPDRKPSDSNRAITRYGYEPTQPVAIQLEPKFFPVGS